MAYAPVESGWGGVSKALMGLGQAASNEGDRQEKARLLLEQMIQQRTQTQLENRLREEANTRAAAEEKRNEAEENRKAGAEERALKYAQAVKTGKAAPAPQGTEPDESAQLTDPNRVPNERLTPDEELDLQAEFQQTPPKDISEMRGKIASDRSRKELFKAFSEELKARLPDLKNIKRGSSTAGEIKGELLAKYGDDPKVVSILNAVIKDPAAVPSINIGYPQGQEIRGLVSTVGGNAPMVKDFNRTNTAFYQANNEYKQYLKNLKNGDNDKLRASQEGIINKYIQTSIGKSANIANFHFLADKYPGLKNIFGNAIDKIQGGSALSPREMESLMEALRQNSIGTIIPLKDMLERKQGDWADQPDLFKKTAAVSVPQLDSLLKVYEGTKFGNDKQEKKTGQMNPEKYKRAQQALNDPEATEEEKSAARRILGK